MSLNEAGGVAAQRAVEDDAAFAVPSLADAVVAETTEWEGDDADVAGDVVVVGGGTAAAVAAAAALDAGANVTLVFPNGGATELSAGVVDVAGVLPARQAGEAPQLVQRYAEGAAELAARYPGHAYALAGDSLQPGLDALAALAAEGGLPLVGFGGRNAWLPNVAGTFTPNAYVTRLQEAAVVWPQQPERVLVAGFAGDVAFDAQAAAASYAAYQGRIGGRVEWLSTTLELDGLAGRHRVTAGEIADYVDTPEGAADLAAKLAQAVRALAGGKHAIDKVVVPPVLGFVNHVAALQAAREAAGVPVGEVQGIANAVTGYRFTRALYAALAARGAVLLRPARATGVEEHAGHVHVDAVAGLVDDLHPGQAIALQADAVVIATGGYVGGGLVSDKDGSHVAVLDVPLGHVAEEQVSRDVVNAAGQAFLRGGLQVESDLRVPGYARVFAVGDVLAGHGGASERSATGVAAATGYMAGRAAARVAAATTDDEAKEA